MNPVARNKYPSVLSSPNRDKGIITGSDRRGHGLGCKAVVIERLSVSSKSDEYRAKFCPCRCRGVFARVSNNTRRLASTVTEQENSQEEEEGGPVTNWIISLTGIKTWVLSRNAEMGQNRTFLTPSRSPRRPGLVRRRPPPPPPEG
jgi:hypothetical protein